MSTEHHIELDLHNYGSRPDESQKAIIDQLLALLRDALVDGAGAAADKQALGIDELRASLTSGKDGSIDGMQGRAAMYKAALQSQWLDEMVPLLFRTGTALTIITREADDPNADARDIKFDSAWKVQGSKSLVYEASLVVRVTRDGFVYDGKTKEDPGILVGERHRCRIWKTKVGGKDDRHEDAYFHTSNGVHAPEGFDRARDVLELAMDLGVVEQAGSWLSWNGAKYQGSAKLLHALRANLAGAGSTLLALEQETRDAFTRAQERAQGGNDGAGEAGGS